MAQSEATVLLGYFDAVGDRFREGMRQANDYFAVEGIHDLRVEIKRMRAFFRLVSFLRPDFDHQSESKSLKSLFGVAGQLRDIDIQQGIVLEGLTRHELSEFANELKQLEFALRPALLTAIGRLRIGTLTTSRRRVAQSLATMSTDEIHDGLLRRISHLVEQLGPSLAKPSVTDIELHEIRKISKATKYTIDAWQMVEGKTESAAQASASLKEVYNHLGKWHDVRVTTEALNVFLGRGAPRNLFDPLSYKKFAAELVGTENSCLAKYRKASLRLRTDLTHLTRATGAHTELSARRSRRQVGRKQRASA
jgi:CHAD domain-containing protein